MNSHELTNVAPKKFSENLPDAAKALAEELKKEGSELGVEGAEGIEGAGEVVEVPKEKTLEMLQEEEGALNDRVAMLEEKNQETEEELNEIREELGLPPKEREDETFSQESNKSRQEQLEERIEALKAEREKLMSKERREELVKIEKNKIMQEKAIELFNEFDEMKEEEVEQIAATGLDKDGEVFKSESINIEIPPEVAQQIAEQFRRGNTVSQEDAIKLFQEVPSLIKEIEKDAEAEAEHNVDERLAELEKNLDEDIEGQEALIESGMENPGLKVVEKDTITDAVEKPAEVNGDLEASETSTSKPSNSKTAN